PSPLSYKPRHRLLYWFDKKILHSSIGLRTESGYNLAHTYSETDPILRMAPFPKTLRDDDQPVSRESPSTPKCEDTMAQAHVPSLDSVICHAETRLGCCSCDDLVQRLPAYSWAQVFAAVDRLSRQGTLTLSRTRCFGYVVSLGPAPPTS